MRAVANLFISRSRAAIFWFGITCAVPIATGYYVQSVIRDVRTHEKFVMGGLPTFLYQSLDRKSESVQQLHTDQTHLAMETIFNRGPSGSLDNADRRFHLFEKDVNQLIKDQIITPDVLYFRNTKSHQKVEVENVVVNEKAGQGEATTLAYGQLFRTGIENGIVVNKSFSVKVFFTWKSNPSLIDHAMYPTICSDLTVFSTIQTCP